MGSLFRFDLSIVDDFFVQMEAFMFEKQEKV